MKHKRKKIKLWVKILLIIVFTFFSILAYSRYFGTKGFYVKEYSIVDNELPNSFYGLKIIHISDIHYKTINDKKSLMKIVNNINLLKPDIVILTGDIFDKDIKYSDKDFIDITEVLNKIDYNIGKYAIKGDNDLLFNNWETIINDSNFINIGNSYEEIYNNSIEPILLVGINSNYNEKMENIYKDLINNYKFSILIIHEPDTIKNNKNNSFNLILAGHSMNRLINLPIVNNIFKTNGANTYYKNFYKINNSLFYISSGIGTNKYKLRLNNKPTFNLYRLRNK